MLMIVSWVNTTASAASRGGRGPVTISYCPIATHVNQTQTADHGFTPDQEPPRCGTLGVLYHRAEEHSRYLRGIFRQLNPIAAREMPTKERHSQQR